MARLRSCDVCLPREEGLCFLHVDLPRLDIMPSIAHTILRKQLFWPVLSKYGRKRNRGRAEEGRLSDPMLSENHVKHSLLTMESSGLTAYIKGGSEGIFVGDRPVHTLLTTYQRPECN
jgi:hypothetical protein